MTQSILTNRTQKKSTPIQRIRSLGRAEWLQFFRNRTLLFMAVVFPLGLPLVLFGIGSRGALEAANTFDLFVIYTLLFVQFYTVLSMVTTRRDERVLKRLRTGEARDMEILLAICLPGAVLTIIFSIVIVPILMLMGAPAPVNILPIILVVLLGLVLSSALAFITSGFTRNAEAAQLTSMPVFTIAVLGIGSLRPAFGDGLFAQIIGYTPFAMISDLVQLGWAGATYSDSLAGVEPADFAGVLGESGRPLLIVVAWTVVSLVAARRYIRWDTHR
ncbi:ABC transporter permease [Corynebacterium pacaense]|uniref:ABC transporter permease n=1 Tax=Corynebacterium pacaense TaxID=1816684 RepID=UPI0009BB70B8|nr:ABC transporter permease [Corynebacterium pacaense]